MSNIVADPTKDIVFNAELLRLTAYLHTQLQVLKASPNKTHLDAFENRAGSRIASAIGRVSLSAFHKGTAHVSATIDFKAQNKLARDALAAGKLAAKQMAQTSAKPLEIVSGMSRVRVASVNRAKFAASYQLRSAFFLGTTEGWSLAKKAKKLWVVADTHDLDDLCDDNANQGPISIFSFFDSGVMYCPGHFGCTCNMALII